MKKPKPTPPRPKCRLDQCMHCRVFHAFIKELLSGSSDLDCHLEDDKQDNDESKSNGEKPPHKDNEDE